ncbi:ABC transporter substrate-binding protein [Streptomyces sp. NBC_00154]|uniref:ABC transporter substrate-binding protein n=1 Tax=Streptomyces sp. NBC_00154 TaxID=2975670 RepID=UPI002255DE36|nr:extracellular solute-binding protein [Streptomyces sp. NBC_00154]MCX5317020.1 extracellular solute-binding protein [Streptomyces sp. NBC_00154]
MRIRRASARPWRAAIPALLACVALTATACGSSSGKEAAVKDDPNATVLVWTDSTRQPAFQAFQKANPKTKVKIKVVDPASLLSKIQLANRVGSGWPDVIFDSLPSDVASLSSPLFKYAQPLNSLVPRDVQNNFATHNAACTIDGKLYCLQNDLAQDVLWYNKPLMAKFGYQVPKTWDEYQALGVRVAKEHPGYIIGAAGASTVYYDYLWSSGCPLQSVVSSTQVTINTKDPKCTRVASLLDPLLANGSVSRLSPVDPATYKLAQSGKLLMQPAASWFGQYVFKAKASYGFPNGELAAAPMPTWAGETTNFSGAQGGGIYVVSSHAKNKTGAVAVAQWVATNNTYQSTAPTYPAYIPAAQAWLAQLKADPFYAKDPSAVLQAAAGKINPAEGPTRYPIEGPVNSTVVAAITGGQSIASAFPALQTQLSGLAQTAGYQVAP